MLEVVTLVGVVELDEVVLVGLVVVFVEVPLVGEEVLEEVVFVVVGVVVVFVAVLAGVVLLAYV